MITTSTARKTSLLLFSVAVLLAGGVGRTVRGQSALDGFDPNANGIVQIVVVQPDGKILIGGDFTTLSPNGGGPVTRNHIARLNPDGTLDTAFNPNADATVFSIVVQADGKILAGGSFTIIGGQTRNYIARLDATTGLADSFNPNANGAVVSIVVQADGKILAAGAFSGANSIGGQTRNYIARIDATTGSADSFNPNANNIVLSIAVQADGNILAGGFFSGANSIGGQTRNFIARLDATTGLADSFNPNAAGFFVQSIAVQADGKILAGGAFTNIGGQVRNNIARVDATTGLTDSFNPNANNTVQSIVVQPDGKILAGGGFSSVGGQTRNRVARLDPSTGLADSFDPNATVFLGVYTMAVQADGKILAGGSFTSLSPNGGSAVPRNYIARLETDGRLDRTLNLNIVGSPIIATAVQPDGKILIGGRFSAVLGVSRNNIARLNPDGTLDTAFNPNAGAPNPFVQAIAVQTDGKILAGGTFTSMGGQTRNNIARLNTDGTLDTAFNPNANNQVTKFVTQADGKILIGGLFTTLTPNGGPVVTRNRIARLNPDGTTDLFNSNADGAVQAMAVQADGKILVGGQFFSIGGQARNFIARLDATTGLADPFDPNANASVESIVVQADSKILIGGVFNGANSIGGQTRNFIARLTTAGTVDMAFDPNANSVVTSLALQADGTIVVGGVFTSIGGQPRNRIARLNTAGTLDMAFDPNANSDVYSIAVPADGKVLVGGQFTSIGGQPRNLFARLSNGTAALQNLAVTQTTVTWTRGGSSPQFERVTFEDSADGVNYTLLGNGTATGSNWTRTGLNFSIGQNFYIRARGYYRTGDANGSESITESIRNTFLTLGISGTVIYCSNPSLNSVPNVTMSLTGTSGGSTTTNGLGNYLFAILASGGSYTVTPTKTALVSGSAGINTVDVIAMQGHALGRPPLLTGCRLTAADVNGDTAVNTVDVIAVQAFALGRASGFANSGKYQFSPVSRSYPGVTSNQTSQNYDTLVFGDVASGYIHRQEGPSQDAADDDDTSISPLSGLNTSADEVPATVATVSLPNVAVDAFVTNFIVQATTTAIDPAHKLIGFQGDLTFDERVVTFQSEPVQKAGITGGNWNVSGNVLPGKGPIRTLRVSAFSNDFTPLSGSGTLFGLRMEMVSKAPQGSPLLWAAPPDNFIFIDADLNTQKPISAASGNLTHGGSRNRE